MSNKQGISHRIDGLHGVKKTKSLIDYIITHMQNHKLDISATITKTRVFKQKNGQTMTRRGIAWADGRRLKDYYRTQGVQPTIAFVCDHLLCGR